MDLLADEAEHVRASGVTVTLGDRRRFAAGVGEWDNGPCQVDLWAAGKWLTCDDNMAFVQQFRLAVLDTAAWLHAGHVSPLPFDGLSPEATHRRLMLRAGADDETEAEYALRRRFRIMDWGPTTYERADLVRGVLGLVDHGWVQVHRIVPWTSPEGRRGLTYGPPIPRDQLPSILEDPATWDDPEDPRWLGAVTLSFTDAWRELRRQK